MDDHPSSTDVMELVRRLATCQKLLRSCLEAALADLELTDTELLVLAACQPDGSLPVAQSAIIGIVGLSPAQLSALVERLRQRGWLDVQRARGDRRKQLLWLTPPGMAQVRMANRRLSALSSRMASTLSPPHRRYLLQGLEQLADFCERTSASSATTSQQSGEAA